MDQSGSRHHTEVTPLIIERPDLAHPLRRIIAFFVTTLIWCWWIILWVPAFEVIADDLGLPVTFYVQPTLASYEALQYLLTQFPRALAVLAAVLLTNVIVTELFQRLTPKPERRMLIQPQVPSPELDPALLAEWQSEKILTVTHNSLGQVTHAAPVLRE